MKRTWRNTVVGLSVIAMVATVFMTAGGAGAQRLGPSGKQSPLANYPRNQTLITSGSQWGNITGTNPWVGGAATGTVGLLYETLLRFDPMKDRYIPWLAQSASFVGSKYVINVRPGVKVDGREIVHRR